ncbi:DUF2848 domain-containing protein [Brachybacterium endophyticum]|uniref:DUF2848 domain-containing protein n=1 Tax=Brachybacterium endophyticum TaxID=2182385 RepID=A0A2U2RIK0_9MICO|nr:DUF2848 domain-containing protein [Brachybacterium endophyticum]PWH05712.1 DUF2848 domain-containing protein [Brachybacterium endophyticum]
MTPLQFSLPNGDFVRLEVAQLLNAGYAGRDQGEVRAHIEELAQLGILGPATTPAMYPVSPYLAQQTDTVTVQHSRTSGEAEWALLHDGERFFLTLACDHTDRALEVHGVAWSKNASPDVLAAEAWPLDEIREHLDEIRVRAWVTVGEERSMIQDAALGALMTPDAWIEKLRDLDLLKPGTVLLSGTPIMLPDVDQFGRRWDLEMHDPVLDRTMSLGYDVEIMPEPIG